MFKPVTTLDVNRKLIGTEIEIASVSQPGKGAVQLVYCPGIDAYIREKYTVWSKGHVAYRGEDKESAIKRYNVEARLL